MEPLLIKEKYEEVLILTLNRPDLYNALSSELLRELRDSIIDGGRDGDVGVIVITGRGKAFCSGGDLEEMCALAEGTYEERKTFLELFLSMIDAIRGISRPVIAAVNGYCIGGGNEINIACDLAVASEGAKFGQAGPKVGSAPLLGGTQLLPLIIGERRAKEMVYLCRPITAHQALEWGLVNRVVPPERLREEALALAKEILDKSPSALSAARESHNVFYRMLRPSMEEGVEFLAQFWGTDEAKEGLRAFKEKRSPNFNKFRVQRKNTICFFDP